MNWEQAKAFGLITIQQPSNCLELHYDRNHYIIAPNPNPYMVIESALWQGNNIYVRGRNQYQEPMIYILKSQYDFERVA